MNGSRRGFSLGSVLVVLVLVAATAIFTLTLLGVLEPPTAGETPPELSSEDAALLESVENAGYTPPTGDKYYHRPVLIAAEPTQTGASAAVWNGLCDYLGTTERTEALYAAADTAAALRDAIDRAETDIVPNLMLVTGQSASEAAAAAQEVYQGTFFAVMDGTLDSPAANTCCITFAAEQAGYLAGYAAVMEGFTQLRFAAGEQDSEAALYRSGFLQGADRAAQNLDVSVWISDAADARGVFDDAAEVAFVCGSTAYQEAAVAEAERLHKKIICSGIDFSYLYENRTEGSSPILTSVVKNYAAVTQSLLLALDNGGWAQFYGGKTLRYDLQWGDTICFTTGKAGWHFTTFSAEQYYQILANLRNDAGYAVSADPPALSSHIHLPEA